MIYLNNAATTIDKPEGVKNPGLASIEEARELTARLLGVKRPEKILFTKGGAESMELALKNFIMPGDHVITTVLEHNSTYKVMEKLAQQGVEISTVGVNPYGKLNYEEIEPLVKENTKAIVCAHGCSVTGNITDLDRVTTIARRHKLIVISDGAQVVGGAEVNLGNLGVDVYCFMAHKKLLGPHGIGGICLKENMEFPESLLNQVEEPDSEKLGAYCAAIKFILEKGIYGICMLPHRLAKRFFESVKSMDAVHVYGDFGTNVRLPIVSIAVDGFTAEEVKTHLQKKFGIVVKSGLQEGAPMHEALGTASNGLIRFSFGYFNTRRDVNDTIWALMDLLGLEDLYLLA